MHVIVKELPSSIRNALHSLGYHKKDIDVEVGESFRAPFAYGAGHRGQVVVVNLATGESRYEAGSWGGGNPFEQRAVDEPSGVSPLPPGFVALTSGHTKIWHLHVNPANAAGLLPSAEAADISIRELWILWAHKGLTSAGRKDEFHRHGRDMGGAPKPDELQRLSAKKLLKINAAGASQITTDGRNFIEKALQDLGVSRYADSYEFSALLKKHGSVTADDILRGAGIKK